MLCGFGKCSGQCGDIPIANGGGAAKRSGNSIKPWQKLHRYSALKLAKIVWLRSEPFRQFQVERR
jgi:hypothetical protein